MLSTPFKLMCKKVKYGYRDLVTKVRDVIHPDILGSILPVCVNELFETRKNEKRQRRILALSLSKMIGIFINQNSFRHIYRSFKTPL